MAKLKPAEGYATRALPLRGRRPSRRDRDYLSDWVATSSVRPLAYAHTDYDFEKPSLSLLAPVERRARCRARFTGEHYRQPGAHLELGRGDAVAAIRREELQAPHVRIRAAGTARGLASGCRFKLEGFPREDQNDEHLVLRADYRLVDPEHRTGIGAGGETYRVALVVAPAALPYRPPRLTPRPVMRGPQTATVVGPDGRGDLHRQVCPGEGAVPLGPPGQARREQLLLRPGLAVLGGRAAGASSRSRASARR